MRVRLRESEPEPGRPARAKANQTESPKVQRQYELGQEVVMGLQRSAGNAGVAELMAEEGDERALVERAIGSTGRPLEGETRRDIESTMRTDLSDVRVHTDRTATASAQAVQAAAYTVGNDVVVQSDRYAPETAAGRELLAHELTHVVQQRSGPVEGSPGPGGLMISHPSDRFELAAERAARDVAGSGTAAPRAGVQKAEEDSFLGDEATSLQRQAAPEEEVVDDEEKKKRGMV
jgi:Domain of unknown function (DUF4157)